MWRWRVRIWGGAGRVIGCVDNSDVGVSSYLRRGRRLTGDFIGRFIGHFIGRYIGHLIGRLLRQRVLCLCCALSCR